MLLTLQCEIRIIMVYIVLLICFLQLCISYCSSNSSEILILTSSSSGFNTSGALPAIDLALSFIKTSNSCLLNGSTLSYSTVHVLDSQCNTEHTVEVLKEQLSSSSRQPVAVIGCGCSNATEAIAKIPELYNIPVISYASTSVTIRDLVNFPPLIRVGPNSQLIASAITSFISMYEWKQVELVAQSSNSNTFQIVNRTLYMEGYKVNIHLYQKRLEEFDNLFNRTESRIFILDTGPLLVKYIMTQAQKHGIKYPSYVFVIVNNFSGYSIFKYVANNSIIIQPYIQNVSTTISGLSLSEFQTFYNNSVSRKWKTSFAPYAFDAVWTLALAINQSSSNLIDNLLNLTFTGITGDISFNELGDRPPNEIEFLLTRQQDYISDDHNNVTVLPFARFNGDELYWINGLNNSDIWPAGIPSDATTATVIKSGSMTAFTVMCILSIFGVVWSLLCLLFNIWFRKSIIIRLTTPSVNYLLAISGGCLYISIILFSHPVETVKYARIFCNLRSTLPSLLYDMCFATITVKVWRIFYIFRNPKPNQKIPKDWHLFLIISVIVLIDACVIIPIISVGLFLDTPQLIKNNEVKDRTNEDGVIESTYLYVCRRGPFFAFSGTFTIVYKLTLHAVALFMAFRTRNVKISVLNDYKYNAAIVYIASALMIIGVISLSSLGTYPTIRGTILTMCFHIGCSLFLGLTFIPKMVALYKDPQGDKVFNHSANITPN